VVNGKWHIDARLGSGGMATVYAATHRNGHRAALKMLHAQLSRDAATRARFLREAYVANSVGHAGVVRVHDDDVADDGSAFLVLDLLDGETMEARRLRLGGALEVDEALAIADEALDVLAAAHEKGIVHRDVKPENVFLTSDGKVKLLDFGLARMKDFAAETTKTGVTIGTPEFMPPEQAQGKRDAVDARSDVWGMGATLFTSITGQYVHDASSIHEQLVASATKRARSVRALAQDIAPSVAVVIDRALELEQADRWASAREMQRALRAARGRPSLPPRASDSLTMPAVTPAAIQRADSGRPTSSGPTLHDPLVPSSDPTIEETPPRTPPMNKANPANPPNPGNPPSQPSTSGIVAAPRERRPARRDVTERLLTAPAMPPSAFDATLASPFQDSTAPMPPRAPRTHGTTAPPPPAASSVPASTAAGPPSSMRQRRSARVAVVVCIVLIVACALVGAIVLLRHA